MGVHPDDVLHQPHPIYITPSKPSAEVFSRFISLSIIKPEAPALFRAFMKKKANAGRMSVVPFYGGFLETPGFAIFNTPSPDLALVEQPHDAFFTCRPQNAGWSPTVKLSQIYDLMLV